MSRWLPYTAAALYGRCITSLLRVASSALGAPGIFAGENEPRTHFGVAIGFVLASTAIALAVEVRIALYGKSSRSLPFMESRLGCGMHGISANFA